MQNKTVLCYVCLSGVLLLTAPLLEARETSYASIEKGRYLARAGDCAACHTAEGGRPFAGGRAIPTPFGIIYSTNITPDKETGIGRWSDDDFYNAMHKGIGLGGKRLYPAFPYPWYTKLGRDDVLAIKTYLNALQPVKQSNRPSELPWPLSWRPVMAGWNALYFHEGTFRANTGKSETWNRGAYLVEGLGHCGACHTPKNIAGAPKQGDKLEGGYGEHWYASSLAGDVRDGLGGWSMQDIVEYLKTGSNGKAAAAGPMAEVVANSTQHLSDADLVSIATYLKDLPGDEAAGSVKAPSVDKQAFARGQALYFDQCAGCHMKDGSGIAQVFPPLKASAPVQAKDAGTVILSVLSGAKVVATSAKPTGLAMPAFGWKLSDADVADLVTYIRNAWGNSGDGVSASEVANIRKTIDRSAQQ